MVFEHGAWEKFVVDVFVEPTALDVKEAQAGDAPSKCERVERQLCERLGEFEVVEFAVGNGFWIF